jgi:acyl-CoA reductase-like NAD-dependent aldehyde dehydrogenase
MTTTSDSIELASIDARTGVVIETVPTTSLRAIEAAAVAAGTLFRQSRRSESDASLRLLAALADELDGDATGLIAVADRETALGPARLRGELARTAFQLRAFTAPQVLHHLPQALTDTADPDRVPPRSSQRRRNVPVGPVAVFAASNFPFAFGLAGGDTASALAAGCPVVVKAHPAQPSTGARIAQAIDRAITSTGVDPAWLQVVSGASPDSGAQLVGHPAISAVGFTGSTAGGTALVDVAARRARPIPVFAEMGSVNPSHVAPHAAATRTVEIATSWAATLSGNAGQFCTKPGLILVPEEHAAAFGSAAADALGNTDVPPMVHPNLARGYEHLLDRAMTTPGVKADLYPPAHSAGNYVPAAVLTLSAATLFSHPEVADEIFGPAGIVVACADGDHEQLTEILPGALASSIIADPEDTDWVHRLLPVLETGVGRIVFNAWPTGVSIGWATVHGGPWPATSAPATTSVGYTAALRWLRPVAYEHFPDELLPADVMR